jgi:hypothetical protein
VYFKKSKSIVYLQPPGLLCCQTVVADRPVQILNENQVSCKTQKAFLAKLDCFFSIGGSQSHWNPVCCECLGVSDEKSDPQDLFSLPIPHIVSNNNELLLLSLSYFIGVSYSEWHNIINKVTSHIYKQLTVLSLYHFRIRETKSVTNFLNSSNVFKRIDTNLNLPK